jgi:hypothetical protein
MVTGLRAPFRTEIESHEVAVSDYSRTRLLKHDARIYTYGSRNRDRNRR